jgi:hypothetical protein
MLGGGGLNHGRSLIKIHFKIYMKALEQIDSISGGEMFMSLFMDDKRDKWREN